MERLVEQYMTSANESIHIQFTRPSSSPEQAQPILEESFNPTFTYPIFGDEETIIGYKEPRIDLSFRANDLKPSLRIEHQGELPLEGLLPEDKIRKIDTVFEGILPASVLDSTENFQPADAPDPTSSSWKPPGKSICSFTLHGKVYEIWRTNFTDSAGKQLWRNMQILVLLFIEGASLLELDEDWNLERWTLYLLYEVTPLEDSAISPYILAGFSTSYRYWILPTLEIMRATKSLPSPPSSSNGDATPSTHSSHLVQDPETFLFTEQLNPLEALSRERISQFLILPNYQGQALGTKLYKTIFADLVNQPKVFEITVEDPNEAFDALRDFNDIVYLRNLPAFASLSLASALPPAALRKDAPIPRDQILGKGVDLTALRHETKIAPRQFNRMLELHLFSTLPPNNRNTARITRKDKSSNENDRKYYFWRLAIKERIYRQNADTLEQLEDAAEKVEKLEAAVDGQQEEYEERLQGIAQRAGWNGNEDVAQSGESKSRSKRKRVVIEDEDDDSDNMDVASTTSKKARN